VNESTGSNVLVEDHVDIKEEKNLEMFRKHVVSVTIKHLAKLKHNTRFKWSGDTQHPYDLHILCDFSNSPFLLFVACTTLHEFDKNFQVGFLLQELKRQVYKQHNKHTNLQESKRPVFKQHNKQSDLSPQSKETQDAFQYIQRCFGTSKLQIAQARAEDIESKMKENVDLALVQVENLSELEAMSLDTEVLAKKFQTGAKQVECQILKKHWKLVTSLVVLVFFLIFILAFYHA
jgi:hypothetical protein